MDRGIFASNEITSIVMPAAFEQFPSLGLPESFDDFYNGNGKAARTPATAARPK
jgi:hypothetical protein